MTSRMIELIQADAMDVMATIPDQSVDLIVADLPYSKTALPWDRRLPMTALWDEWRRILTSRGTVVAFGVGHFSIELAAAALDLYKYSLVWRKPRPTQHMHVRNRPLAAHEDVLVFSRGAAIHPHATARRMTYNADGHVEPGTIRNSPSNVYRMPDGYAGRPGDVMRGASTSILDFAKDARRDLIHPTQKPVALIEWLIRAYSNPGDLILDPTMGSGTTGVACRNLDRDFIGIEADPRYFDHAYARIHAIESQAAA